MEHVCSLQANEALRHMHLVATAEGIFSTELCRVVWAPQMKARLHNCPEELVSLSVMYNIKVAERKHQHLNAVICITVQHGKYLISIASKSYVIPILFCLSSYLKRFVTSCMKSIEKSSKLS